MKQLISIALALLLTTGGGLALADKGRHDGHGGNRGGGHGHDYKHGHGYGHWKKGYRYPAPIYYYPRVNYNRYAYYPLGTALVASAVNYSLYHNHGGVSCYEQHAVTYPSPAPEVVGCHRIERYPDGTQQRVDVPLSECY